jgi:hypothetical protein
MPKLPFLLLTTLLVLFIPQLSYAKQYKNVDRHLSSLPKKHHQISHRGKSYYYTGGSFYRPRNGGYLSISAPIGAIVPGLSSGYVTFGVGPNRYYYLSGIYYRHAPGGYVVVQKPDKAETVLASKGSDKLIIYPAIGQSLQQKKRDKYDCHEWATGESGFDPTDADADHLLQADYKRAMSACLEGKGYVVK